MGRTGWLTARDVLRRYVEEDLPDFMGIDLVDVNQHGRFGDTPLGIASVRGIIEEVEALLAGGADVDVAGELGNTPLHNAAGQGHDVVVRMLLKAGADPGIKNEDGKTARDVAILMKNDAVVAALDAGTRRS